MNAIEIILLLAVIASGAMYYFKFQQVKKQDELVKYWIDRYDSEEKSNLEYSQSIKLLEDEIHKVATEKAALKYDLEAFKAERRDLKHQISELKEIISGASKSHQAVDLRLFIEKYEDMRFVNTGIINLHSIALKDIEIIHEDHIKVIRSLAKKGYFRDDLKSKFNYNPQSGQVEFHLFEVDSDGDPKAVKNWKDFLQERIDFKNTITEYIVGVIGQREINKAVDEAIAEKEVSNA